MAQRLRAMEARGIRMHSIYVNSAVGRAQPLPGDLEATLDIFKGRDIVVWLNMASEPKTAPKGSLDDAAAAIVRDVAAMAKARGLRVALYGHKNLYIETAEDGLRIAQKAGCDNVGVTFNLCHELMSGNEKRLAEIIQKVAPRLTLVSINGADLKNKNYIMRLDQGDLDLLGLLREFEKAGYRGPIGLQCYKVPGDVRENLVANMAAWRKLMQAFVAR
jgi:sugar phosphate isomerase/epimerase